MYDKVKLFDWIIDIDYFLQQRKLVKPTSSALDRFEFEVCNKLPITDDKVTLLIMIFQE
ncbi:MAG: hypothetical protein R2757_05400 [Draconibacterium sp.]